MTVTHILVTNVLPTGTAFGVLADNHGESVFIPARINASMPARLVVGQRRRALIIPNQSHQDRTPWIVLQLEDEDATKPRSALADLILRELGAQGNSTGDEIADSVGHPADAVARELQNLVAHKCVTSYVVFDLMDPAS